MAITLDELLGRNTSKETETIERFPSYEAFRSRNGRQSQTEIEPAPRYNFEQRPYTPPVSEERVRQYEASRPYEAPRLNEYQNRDYGFYEAPTVNRAQIPDVYAETPSYGYGRYEDYAKNAGSDARKTMNLYEFTANDRDRLSERELMSKLSHTDEGRRPLFDRQADAVQTKRVSFASEAQAVKNAAAPVERERSEVKKRARLNTKGKIILAVYIALIVLVAVLIIVNAGDINRGTATAPSSNAIASASSDVAYAASTVDYGNISQDIQINCLYDAIF